MLDTNNGRAYPCAGDELVAAIRAAQAEHPNVRFWGNDLGNMAAYCGEEFVGFIDARALSVGDDGAWRWDSTAAPCVDAAEGPVADGEARDRG